MLKWPSWDIAPPPLINYVECQKEHLHKHKNMHKKKCMSKDHAIIFKLL